LKYLVKVEKQFLAENRNLFLMLFLSRIFYEYSCQANQFSATH